MSQEMPAQPLATGVTFPHLIYSGGRLDRAALRRRDADWIEARRQALNTRFVPLWREQHLWDEAGLMAARLNAGALTAVLPDAVAQSVFLGLETVEGQEGQGAGESGEGQALFAVDVSALSPEALADWAPVAVSRWADLRGLAVRLPPHEAALSAYARGLLLWHRRHRYCGVCGHPTDSDEGGHVRRCTHPLCRQVHFPRTDPAVIMLVHDGQHVLLARQPRFTPGLYSVLAGFVEPGESLEDAVVREVWEETGVPVIRDSVRYVASQPWPYPASLMIAFVVRAIGTTPPLTLQAEELEAARWVSREELHDRVPTPEFFLPRADAAAHHLIREWCAGRL